MDCPYCGFYFKVIGSNTEKIEDIPAMAPAICEGCGRISLLDNGRLRTINAVELAAIKISPAWEYLKQAQEIIEREHARARQAGNVFGGGKSKGRK